MKKYIIGVDIGGTNSDVVLLDEQANIVVAHKEITSFPIEEAAAKAIQEVCSRGEIFPEQVDGVFFGTTHATNAILEAKDLLRVGLIRIAGHVPDTTSCFFWPEILQSEVLCAQETIPGGFECDGEPITPFDSHAAATAVERLLEAGCQAISVVGVFASIYPEQEVETKEIIARIAGPSFPVSLSSDIGGIGFIERENATILNSALKKVITVGFSALEVRMRQMGIQAPLWMVQNDGSIMDLAKAAKFPIFTISAGQTNSFIGASKQAGLDKAIVIDIGGTSTDIGVVQNGFPRRSCHAATIGGVSLHFSMPDVLSLAIGGGSLIGQDLSIGPKSVARRLKEESQSFGGKTITLTDVGVLLGVLSIPEANPEMVTLTVEEAVAVMIKLQAKLLYAISLVEGKEKDLPIVVVGGAACLIRDALIGTELESRLCIPKEASVANAYGAALAEVSSTLCIVASLMHGREVLLDEMKMKVTLEAIKSGAHPDKVRISNLDIIPYAYSKDGLAKVTVTASGPRT